MKKLSLIIIALIAFAQTAWAQNVGNESELRNAITNGANITLTQDIDIGSAITVGDGQTVTINLNNHILNRGCTSRGSQAIGVYSGGTLYLSNGTVTGGWGGGGGAMFNEGTMELTNVIITGNTADDRGGGLSNNGTLTMTGCTVSNNTSRDAVDPAGGGGIFNYSGMTATLTNCTITSNTATTYGGGGICNYGTMYLNSCTLTNNSANTNGGGIFCSTTSTLSINGCDITGNSAGSYGDGIYIDNSTFNMQGLCTVTGNTDSNIYLYGSGTKITVTGAFTNGSDIGVGFTDYGRKFTSGFSTYNEGTDPGEFFTSDNYKYGICEKDGEAFPGVYYMERSWEGGNTDGHVVSTTKLYTGGRTLNGSSNLSGWYYADRNDTYEDNRISIDGDTHLILLDGMTLTCKKGIHIKPGKTLTIYSQSVGENMGYLKCTGSDGENGAIGGNASEVGGNLVIHGGKIYAKPSSNNAAGIGGGEGSKDNSTGMESITIWSGIVEAYGKSSGAGIGCGEKNTNPPLITIYGDSIVAEGGKYGAGIGGSEECGNGTIKIFGGRINATGGGGNEYNTDGAAGIGGGEKGGAGNIYIYGGHIYAQGGQDAAGVGGGWDGDGGNIYIYGGFVQATGGNDNNTGAGETGGGPGIGPGRQGAAGTIHIYDGVVEGIGKQGAAGIGTGELVNGGTIIIDGGYVFGMSYYYGAGIGGGSNGNGGTITINGGYVEGYGGDGGSGIGGGKNCDGGNITINGGNITAEGGSRENGANDGGAGIGGGYTGNGGTITINGGTISAKGIHGGAGIGGGCLANGGTVTITGGTITVEGGSDMDAPAIGGGDGASDNGSLTLPGTYSVQADGSEHPVNCANRISTLRETGKYTIQECEHSGGISYSVNGDSYYYYHHINCEGGYCYGYNEHHIKGDGDTCTKCGMPLPVHAYTFYEAKADGSGYQSEGAAYYVTATNEFTFPECSVVPNKKVFVGWLLSNDTVPSSLIAGSTENLIQADSTITVPMEENRTYYARFKNTYFSGGSGSASDPFLISDTEDWDHLAQAVNDGINFNGMYFVMTNDINVSTMVGQGSNRFRGNFDGQGNTITVSYTGITEDYCAPFRHISGATIKNLNTTGTIETSGRYAAGVVAYTRYYSKIENCRSNVTIRSSREGWAGHGGILGLKANVSYSQPTIVGCVFDGKILSTGATATTGGGGIVGLTNGQTLTIENCLYKPAALENNETAVACATIYANSSSAPSSVTCTDCYYTEAYGSAESGTQGYTVTSGTTGLTLDFGSASSTYAYNGIRVYSFGLSYDGLLYSGNGQNVTFTIDVAEGYTASDIKANGNALTPDSNGIYTLTMPNANVSITATMTPIASREVAAAEDWTTASKGWVFIASPVITSEDMEPEDVSGLVAENEDDYDLYRLNPSNTKWENWKEHEGNAAAGFCLENGRGYLYATKYAMTLIFAGTFNTKDKDTIPLSPGFNLVGNPFTVAANINKPYYTLNSDGSAVQTETSSEAIPPCHGVIVEATSANDSVVFTRATQQSAVPSNSGLNIALTQANTRGASTGSAALLDNAIITFNEGSQLGKFYFGKQNANIYLPQGGKEYAIVSIGNGRDAARHVSTNEVPLNFKAKENGEYTISVNPEGVEMAYLHLIDNMTGSDIDLLHPETLIAGEASFRESGTQSPAPSYTFTAKTTDYTSRFKLVFAVNDGSSTGSETFAFISNGNLIVNGEGMLQVIDMMGRVIVSRDAARYVSTNGMAPGVYVLRLIDGDSVRTQKIVVR